MRYSRNGRIKGYLSEIASLLREDDTRLKEMEDKAEQHVPIAGKA